MTTRNGLLGCLALGVAWPALGQAQTIDRRIAAEPNGVLEIVNPDGDVRIDAWDQNEVYVTGDLGGASQLDVRADGNRIVVEVNPGRGQSQGGGFFGGNGEGGADLVIRAPATIAIDIRTRSADIDLNGMRGEQNISGVSGDIRSEAYDKEVRVETVSGDVRIQGRDGRAIVRSSAVSGDVRLGDVSGEIWADTVSGDVTVVGGTLARAEFKSVSGDIRVSASIESDARLDAIATSGDIDIDFVGSAAGDYRLETFSGELETCFGPRRDSNRDSRFGPGEALRFTEGSSGARIEVRTHSGDIRICRE
jgi:DUF4097 and DUF4098 domain-containing protein YvlB